jgi:hypothetical protein
LLVKTKRLGQINEVRGSAWFNSECRGLKKEMNISLRLFRKVKAKRDSDLTREKYLEAKAKYKHKIKECRAAFYLDIHNKLRDSKCSKDFYSAIKRFRNTFNCHNDKQVPIEAFQTFFSKVYSSEHQSNEPTINETVSSRETEMLDAEFSLGELDKAIRKLSKGKASGSDGIPNEAWQALGPEARLILLNEFNDRFSKGDFPANWSEIVIVPIYKKSDPSTPQNYRPIALANTVLKLFTIILSNRLLNWGSKTKLISDYQAA